MSTSDKRTVAYAVLDPSGNPTGEIVAAGKSVTAVTAKSNGDGGIVFDDGVPARAILTAGMEAGQPTGFFTQMNSLSF